MRAFSFLKAYLYKRSFEQCADIPDSFFQDNTTALGNTSDFLKYTEQVEKYVRTLDKLHAESDQQLLSKVQFLRVKKIIKIADRTTWWHSYFIKQGITPASVKQWSDFEKITPIDRSSLVDVPKRDTLTISSDSPKLVWRSSSGTTTGTPFYWALPKTALIMDVLGSMLRALGSRGFKFDGLRKEAFFLHVNMFFGAQHHAFKWFAKNDYSVHFRGDAKDLDAEIEALDAIIRKTDNIIILTGPSELSLLVDAFKKRNIRPRVPFFMTIGAPLQESVRIEAEEYFQSQILAYYGVQELGPSAIECKTHRGFHHVLGDRVLVEIVDDSGHLVESGTEGKVTVSCLDNEAMPLLRYQPGDLGVLHSQLSCDCDNNFPLLEIISRTSDVAVLSDGSKRSLYPLMKSFGLIDYVKYVRRFQIRQEKIDEIIVVFEVRSPLPPSLISDVQERVRIMYEGKLSVMVETTDAIPQREGEKFKSFIALKKN